MTRSGANRGVTVVTERQATGERGCPVSHPEHGDTPSIEPEELAGKFIVLAILTQDEHGRRCSMGGELQLNLLELTKADRLGVGDLLSTGRKDSRMEQIDYTPVQQALGRIRGLSADAETQRMAFVRERTLRMSAANCGRRGKRDEKRAWPGSLSDSCPGALAPGRRDPCPSAYYHARAA